MTHNEWRPDIESVFDHYGARILSSSGQWQKAECPLTEHEDRNPSASVNVDSGKWRCWSCEGRGDALDIIEANEENCAGFTDALAFAQEHFPASGGTVLSERGRGPGVSRGPATRKRARNWSPPWRLS